MMKMYTECLFMIYHLNPTKVRFKNILILFKFYNIKIIYISENPLPA